MIVGISIPSDVAAIVPIGASVIGVSSICPSMLIHEMLGLEGLQLHLLGLDYSVTLLDEGLAGLAVDVHFILS